MYIAACLSLVTDCICPVVCVRACKYFQTYISEIVTSGFHSTSVGREMLSIPQNSSGFQAMYSLCHTYRKTPEEMHSQGTHKKK